MTRRLAEVARKVGVSEATVSRVLNGKPGVAEPTRQAVLTALDVLGYERPSKLRGERARLVGLVLPELQNPIFPAFAEVMGVGLAQRGFTAVLCTQTEGGVSEAEYVELLIQQQVSGVVFAGGLYAQEDAPHGHYARLAERDHIPSRRKVAAAEGVAAKAGIPLGSDRIARAWYSIEAAQAGAARLIQAGVTGIVCASDLMALGAIRAARRAGRSVPGDISVIGFDDSFLMNSTDPALTTVRQPIEPMARMVIELLARQVAGTPIQHEELLFEPELVVRASTGPVRSG
jgi:DNA-binding LacI/PurR family transcriptional regulator